MKLVYGPLMGGLLHLVQRSSHPSTASVPITVLLYNGPLLCGFFVSIEGLKYCIFRRPTSINCFYIKHRVAGG